MFAMKDKENGQNLGFVHKTGRWTNDTRKLSYFTHFDHFRFFIGQMIVKFSKKKTLYLCYCFRFKESFAEMKNNFFLTFSGCEHFFSQSKIQRLLFRYFLNFLHFFFAQFHEIYWKITKSLLSLQIGLEKRKKDQQSNYFDELRNDERKKRLRGRHCGCRSTLGM